MKKKQIIWLQIIYWSFNFIGNVITPIIFFPKKNGFYMQVLDMTYFIVGIATFYVCYLFIIPKVFDPKKLYTVVLVFILSIACFAILRYLIEEVFLPATLGFRNYNKDTSFAYYFFDNIYYGSINVFIAGILWLLKKFGVIEAEKKQLEVERNKAQIQALKTQINPHFIFNTLNNIYSLVNQKSDKSLVAIEKLSDLLRISGREINKDFINLKTEILYIESLIELESLRISKLENISFEDNTDQKHLEIAPMILIPFVENAFKHGNLKEFPLKISIKNEQNKLFFYQKNKIGIFQKDKTSGIGIENVRKRLSILYPDKFDLKISEEDGFYIVELNITL
jgi:two-component system LytT family sensor kinase